MRLTHYTDYAMRVLLYLGGKPGADLSPIAEISRAYGISQNHLMKVVNDLVNAGYLESVRGRYGGVRLARLPNAINIGEVVRHTEDGFNLVDCGTCMIAPACGLTGALKEALAAFMKVLDGYSLEDLLSKRRELQWLFTAPDVGGGKQPADQIEPKNIRS